MIKFLLNVSLNTTLLFFLDIFPAIILPNNGDTNSIIKVGICAFVDNNTVIVQIINNSVNMINIAPYLNKKELCFILIVLNSFSYFLLFYNIIIHL